MKKFAVIGDPISHSLSPSIHSIFAKTLGLDVQYDAVQVRVEDLEHNVSRLFLDGYSGLNITLPLKEKAFLIAKKHSDTSSLAKSANTLWQEDGVMCADSTDGAGLMEDLSSKDLRVEGSNVVVLGAGGSSKAILPSLLSAGPKEVIILNRTLSKAKEIAEIYNNDKTKVTANSLSEELPFKCDGIINTTSAGLLGQEIIYPNNLFNSYAWSYDLNYAETPTSFNELSKKNKISSVYDGLGMLFRQAALSFEIWTGLKPDVEEAIKVFKI